MQGILRVGRVTVVVVWVGLLLALAHSQWPQTASRQAAQPLSTAAVPADDSWMGVYMHGQKIGYSHTRIDPTASGYQLQETSLLRLSVLEEVQTVRVAISAATGADFAVRDFTVKLDSGLGVLAVRGTVDGSVLVLHMTTGSDTTEQRIPLAEPIYLPSSARAHLGADALQPNQTVTLRVFDPSAMEHQPLTMNVIGRERLAMNGGASVEAWKVRETFRGMETAVWMDDAGHTLREEGPLGMIAQREDASHALSDGWSTDAFDLMSAIAVPAKPIADPRHLAHLTARMEGVGELPIPNDRRQTLRDGILRVEREAPARATYTLPYHEDEWRAELAATPFLQVEHPRVRAAAREALGDETDPLRAADRLREWVYRELDKRPLASIPNAVQVLEMRAGDCNEHAVLFAALARAVGLPARVVAGVVYANGAFLYHAWDEVWLGGGWLSVDPAFDQMPADATHVKLIEGGPETHAGLVSVIGKLSIDIMPEPAAEADS
jgi:hypothetical protein